jgi:hypothetical protein
LRRIRDQRLADIEPGRDVPKAEARGDVGTRKIVRRVSNRAIGEKTKRGAQRDLQSKRRQPRLEIVQ